MSYSCYNREWLRGIDDTWALIKNAPLDEVPFVHRALIKQQFDCHVSDFKMGLAGGLNTDSAQRKILDLFYLAIELIEEDAKRQAEATATYGR